MQKNELSAADKLAVIQEIEMGLLGVKAAVEKYGISRTSLARWRRLNRVYGYKGLEIRTHYQGYSAELKLQAVKEYLQGITARGVKQKQTSISLP